MTVFEGGGLINGDAIVFRKGLIAIGINSNGLNGVTAFAEIGNANPCPDASRCGGFAQKLCRGVPVSANRRIKAPVGATPKTSVGERLVMPSVLL